MFEVRVFFRGLVAYGRRRADGAACALLLDDPHHPVHRRILRVLGADVAPELGAGWPIPDGVLQLSWLGSETKPFQVEWVGWSARCGPEPTSSEDADRCCWVPWMAEVLGSKAPEVEPAHVKDPPPNPHLVHCQVMLPNVGRVQTSELVSWETSYGDVRVPYFRWRATGPSSNARDGVIAEAVVFAAERDAARGLSLQWHPYGAAEPQTTWVIGAQAPGPVSVLIDNLLAPDQRAPAPAQHFHLFYELVRGGAAALPQRPTPEIQDRYAKPVHPHIRHPDPATRRRGLAGGDLEVMEPEYPPICPQAAFDY